MKKTLIALAAFAVATAAMADVTITGTLSAGYLAANNWTRDISQDKADGSTVGIKNSGFGINKAQINITASSKIDANQEIIAKLGLNGLDRSMSTDPSTANGGPVSGKSVTGGDTSIAYINQHVGKIQVGNITDENFFVGIASANSPTFSFDNKMFEQRSANDYISYTVPVGPVYLIATHNEGSAGLGIGKGETGSGFLTSNYQRNNQLTAYYKGNNIEAALTYRQYDNRKYTGTIYKLPMTASGMPVTALVDGAFLGTKDNVINLQTSYDFGFAKLGYGVQLANATNGTKILDSLVGLTIPVGNWTFGGTFAVENGWNVPKTTTIPISLNGTVIANLPWNLQDYQGTTTGYSLGAAYNFSKQTQLIFKYAAWTASGYNRYQNDAANMGNASTYVDGTTHTSLNGIGGMGKGLATLAGVELVHSF